MGMLTPKSGRLSEKRKVPIFLKNVLIKDELLTKNFVKFVDNQYGPIAKFRSFFKKLEISCHGIPWMTATVASLFLFANSYILFISVNLLLALLFDIIVVSVIKAVIRRRRPSGNINDMFATYNVDKFSFPSGHATRAIMITTFIFIELKDFIIMKGLFVIWGIAIPISRVLLQRHHILDVLAGVCLGYLEAYFFYTFLLLSSGSCNYLVTYLMSTDYY